MKRDLLIALAGWLVAVLLLYALGFFNSFERVPNYGAALAGPGVVLQIILFRMWERCR